MTDRPTEDDVDRADDWAQWFDREYGAPELPAPDPAAPPAAPTPVPPAPAPLPPPASGTAPAGDGDGEATGGDRGGGWVEELFDGSDETPSAGLPRASWWRRRRVVHWATRPWPASRIVTTATTAATLLITTAVMMSVVHFNPLAWAGIGWRDLIFDDTTPAGGDMGSHVWAPAYLRDVLLPDWRVSGWTMDWYAGFPAYRFYMVVPALAIVALDTFLPYGVAFKVVAMSGMVSLPFCAWAFGRLARFRFPVPELFAFGGLCWVLNESYTIWGGNVLSTMAGEFSFSIAISLMLLGLGMLCRALDASADRLRHLVPVAGLLALACLSHGIVLIYTAIAAVVIVLCRCGADLLPTLTRRVRGLTRVAKRRLLAAALMGVLTAALSAFWVGPFLFNHEYMTDMKYGFRPDSRIYTDDSYWDLFFDQKPALDVIINLLAAFGVFFAVVRRSVYGIALAITTGAAVGLVYLAHDSLPVIGLLWNPRVLPFVYLLRYLLMMLGVAGIFTTAANIIGDRPARTDGGWVSGVVGLVAAGLAVLFAFGWVYQVLPGGGFVTKHGDRVYAWGPFAAPDGQTTDARGDSWTSYNWNGYERRPAYPEYYDLIETMDTIGDERGCGRALWERDQRDSVGNTRYGSSMALMLLPFWTDGCIASSEGLFFEASGTTPYHFLAAAAMSDEAGSPVRQSRDVRNDAAVGVPYLQSLGIRYLMVTRPDAIAEADAQAELTPIDESGPWRIYEVADADVVVPLDVEPVVVPERDGDRRECWLEVGSSWFQNRDEWAAIPAADGPADWQRIDVAIDPERQVPQGQSDPAELATTCGDPSFSVDRDVNVVVPVTPIEPRTAGPARVSNVELGDQSVSFDVDRPGVPILVKVSYFPNWEATGAQGPYRIAPNFMVVVPTATHVDLRFARTTSDLAFDAATALALVGSLGVGVRRLAARR